MEGTYNFLKITLLGLILGVLIIFIFQVEYWAEDFKKAVRHPVVYQDHDYRNKPLKEHKRDRSIYNLPTNPKHKI
jgi:hypothetical protein